MTRQLSTYLDAVRFLAALTVFLGHVSGNRFTGGLFWQFGPFMSEAVTIFFVLSGFVIGYATGRAGTTLKIYAIARMARIYSVALPALLITVCLDSIGRQIQPQLYSLSWGYVWDGRLWQFASGLTFLNAIWYSHTPQGSMLPFWSLGYEVWYYVIFGVMVFVPRRWTIISIIGLLVFVGPNIAAMFPLWLAGLYSYRICQRMRAEGPKRFQETGGLVLCMGSLAIWLAYECGAFGNPHPADNIMVAWVQNPELIQNYLVGALFSVHIIGFHAISGRFGFLDRVAPVVRWVAGATFTLYLIHLPIAQFLATLVPWSPGSLGTRVTILGGTLIAVFLVAEITERRREWWRRACTMLMTSIVGGAAVSARVPASYPVKRP